MTRSITLQKRMFGGLVVMMMMFALITGYLVTRLGAVKSGSAEMRATAVDVENINQSVKSLDDFLIQALLVITNLNSSGGNSVKKLDATFGTLNKSMVALDRNQDPGISKAVKELHVDLDPIADSWTKARTYFQDGRMTEGLGVALPIAQPHIDPALETLKKLNVMTSKISEGAYSDVSHIYSNSRSLGMVGIGLTMGLSLLVMWFLVRSVSSSVGRGADLVASSSADLGAVSARMGASAEETAVQADVVSAAAAQVSDSVQTVASAVEEMSVSVREIA
ncbi:MAG: hypothetical protein HYR89_10700, partial [Actinobacteria bacterium]|nr:hypothetical protein [Actinomycetota bacterium]